MTIHVKNHYLIFLWSIVGPRTQKPCKSKYEYDCKYYGTSCIPEKPVQRGRYYARKNSATNCENVTTASAMETLDVYVRELQRKDYAIEVVYDTLYKIANLSGSSSQEFVK